jgi:hypothetical protein
MNLNEMTPEQRIAAIERAADQMQRELQASAPAISKIMDDAMFIPCNTSQLVSQIARMTLAAISGCRVIRRETGITLPVSNGYSVTIDLAAGDTYTVRRVFTRAGKTWVKGERTDVHAEEVSEAAYYASCFRSYGETEWMTKR